MFQKVETACAQSGTGREHGKPEGWEEESPVRSSGTRMARDMDGKTSTKLCPGTMGRHEMILSQVRQKGNRSD